MSELINKITEIANAIRTKKNTTEKIPLVNFPSEILSIETKSDPVIEELTVTENGTYTVPSGTDGYNPVVVNVPTGGGGEKVEIENADSLFSECKFYQGIFNMCDFTNATDFTNAFYSSDAESISFTTWPTSKFVKIDYMFNSCPSLISVDFSLLDVMRIESASRTFAASNITVHLDPGHYGNKYNQGINKNYYESAMTWKLSGYLKSELENKGIKVTLSRNSIDEDPSLYNRGYGSKGKTVFISLHSNACGTESVDYPLVIGSIKSDNSALDLANKLGQVIKDTIGTSQNYKVITKEGSNGNDYYGVIRGAAAANVNYNYILEHGFHTNTKNCNWLLSDDNLKTLAKKEADTIASFFNVKNSNSTTETKTEEKKEENKTTKSTSTNTSTTYTTGMYKVNVNSLNIRKGPGTDYVVVGCIKDKGTYTITEIKNGSWGRLKNGAGWINIHKNYCTKSKTTSSTTTKTTTSTKKSNEEVAKEVLKGLWGNGSERKKKLEAAGYNYSTVQSIVNKLCK